MRPIPRHRVLASLKFFSTKRVATMYGLPIQHVRLIRQGLRIDDFERAKRKRRRIQYLKSKMESV